MDLLLSETVYLIFFHRWPTSILLDRLGRVLRETRSPETQGLQVDKTDDAAQQPAANRLLRAKYDLTAWFYDILDYPWERQYKHWRPTLLNDVRGRVLEAGTGTGRNLAHYHARVRLTAIDLSRVMLQKALKRAMKTPCEVDLRQDDATIMQSVESSHYDWLISTFMCCVMPDELQPLAVRQFERVLKPGGRFRLLEMVYSKQARLKKRQMLFAPFVEKIYGARFDRNTLAYVQASAKLEVTKTFFLKDDTYLVIEGRRR